MEEMCQAIKKVDIFLKLHGISLFLERRIIGRVLRYLYDMVWEWERKAVVVGG
jgi:hypothetical protein